MGYRRGEWDEARRRENKAPQVWRPRVIRAPCSPCLRPGSLGCANRSRGGDGAVASDMCASLSARLPQAGQNKGSNKILPHRLKMGRESCRSHGLPCVLGGARAPVCPAAGTPTAMFPPPASRACASLRQRRQECAAVTHGERPRQAWKMHIKQCSGRVRCGPACRGAIGAALPRATWAGHPPAAWPNRGRLRYPAAAGAGRAAPT